MKPAALILALAALPGLHAQAAASPEISGIVREFTGDATALPVPGARIALFANGADEIAFTFTDANGAYEFHAPHSGDYIVEVSKEGYSPQGSGALSVTLGPGGRPATPLPFYLNRLGELTGRVIDEIGNPVAGLSVAIQRALGDPKYLEATAITAGDGTFTASKLRPGPYVVRISPRSGDEEKVIPRFSEDDLYTVDEDFETTYWPGGFPEPSASIPVNPGASTTIGTINIRKAPYYRAHVSVAPADCSPGEMWTLMAFDQNGAPQFSSDLPCARDFLVRNLPPGSYRFLLRQDEPDPGRWALASVDVSNKNLDVALDLEFDAGIIGRVVAAADATLPPPGKIAISTRPDLVGLAGTGVPATPDAEGKFTLTGLKFPNHKVNVVGLFGTQYYVKEIRFNGAPARDGLVTLSPGLSNQLEIVIDDKPGIITGTVTDDGDPATQALVFLFTQSLQLPEGQFNLSTDKQGKFQFTGLTPGEYRAVAVPLLASRPDDLNALKHLAAQAKIITVERGGATTISLTLTGPAR